MLNLGPFPKTIDTPFDRAGRYRDNYLTKNIKSQQKALQRDIIERQGFSTGGFVGGWRPGKKNKGKPGRQRCGQLFIK